MTSGATINRQSVKVSTTLPAADLDFIQVYTIRHGLKSRAAGFQAAVKALREQELLEQYLESDREWYGSADEAFWDATVGDGIGEE